MNREAARTDRLPCMNGFVCDEDKYIFTLQIPKVNHCKQLKVVI